MNGQNRKDIKIGALVDIVLKKDQRTGKLTRGHVKKITDKQSVSPSRNKSNAGRRRSGWSCADNRRINIRK